MVKNLFLTLCGLSVVYGAIFLKSHDASSFLHGSKVKRASSPYSSCVTSESYCESNTALCTGAGREDIREALCSRITCPLGQMCDMTYVSCPPHTNGVCQPAVVTGTTAKYTVGASTSDVTGTTAKYSVGASTSDVTGTTAKYPVGASTSDVTSTTTTYRVGVSCSGDAYKKALIIGLSILCPLLAVAATILIAVICKYKKRGKVSPPKQKQRVPPKQKQRVVKVTINRKRTLPKAVP